METKDNTTEKIKQLKRSFRLYMNGVASASMRQKGLEYKVNWGISQVDLRRMAAECGKDKQLAEALWHENSRECKLLATLIMPAEQLTLAEASEWVKAPLSVEMAEMLVFNLLQHLGEPWPLVGEMLTSTDELHRLCAYNLVCRLVKRLRHNTPSMPAILWDKAHSDACTANRHLLHALVNCMQNIADLDNEEAKKADSILEGLGFEAF